MLAGRNVLKDPGIIVGPIAFILGAIINVIFNLVYNVLGIHTNSLGISIIILTVFVRLLMTPIAYHQQKSMFKMQALQPEMKKIQEKYKGAMSDPELQRKMNMEMQKLYADNNYNQLAGCLPMLIQLPIFLGLYHVMQNPFKYIDIINKDMTLHLSDNNVFNCRGNLSKLEKQLYSRFLRCHSSYIVNMDCIVSFKRYEFELDNGIKVRISKNNYRPYTDKYIEYITDKDTTNA